MADVQTLWWEGRGFLREEKRKMERLSAGAREDTVKHEGVAGT